MTAPLPADRNEATSPRGLANWTNSPGTATHGVAATGFSVPTASQVVPTATGNTRLRHNEINFGVDLGGQPVSVRLEYKSTASHAVQLNVVCRSAAGADLATFNSVGVTPAANTVQLLRATGTMPAGTTRIQVIALAINAPANATLQATAVRIAFVTDAALPYRDGSSTGWAWDGTVNQSASGVAQPRTGTSAAVAPAFTSAGAGDAVSYPKLSTLTSTFTEMPAFFTLNYGTVSIVNGEGRVATGPYSGFETAKAYSFTGDEVFIKAFAQGTSLSWQSNFQVKAAGTNNSVEILNENGNLIGRIIRDGVFTDQTLITGYNTANPNGLWWRIRESGGTAYFDTSTNGTTWTNRGSVVHLLNFAQASLVAGAGKWDDADPPGTDTVFDNLNTVVATPITGTATNDAPVATSAAAGSVRATGTSAVTSPTSTSTAVATNGVTGTTSNTSTAATSAATATDRVTATSAVTSAAGTSASAATQRVTGASTNTLGAATSAGASTARVTGVHTGTSTPTSSGTATHLVTGSTTNTAPAFTSSGGADAIQPITGTVSSAVSPVSSAATGTSNVSGNASNAAANATSAATATERVFGTAANTSPAASSNVSASKFVTGAVTNTGPASTSAASGSSATTGLTNNTTSAATSTVEGTDKVEGSVSNTTAPADSDASTGAPFVAGVADNTTAEFTSTGAATERVSGTSASSIGVSSTGEGALRVTGSVDNTAPNASAYAVAAGTAAGGSVNSASGAASSSASASTEISGAGSSSSQAPTSTGFATSKVSGSVVSGSQINSAGSTGETLVRGPASSTSPAAFISGAGTAIVVGATASTVGNASSSAETVQLSTPGTVSSTAPAFVTAGSDGDTRPAVVSNTGPAAQSSAHGVQVVTGTSAVTGPVPTSTSTVEARVSGNGLIVATGIKVSATGAAKIVGYVTTLTAAFTSSADARGLLPYVGKITASIPGHRGGIKGTPNHSDRLTGVLRKNTLITATPRKN